MQIKYLACHDTPKNGKQRRAVVPAAIPVINSLSATLLDLGHKVEIVSFSYAQSEKGAPGICYQADEGYSVRLFRSFGRGSLWRRAVNRYAVRWQYFLYLFFGIKKGDTVIAYHSPYYVKMLQRLKKSKDFRLVLQMLEIYADVYGDEELRKQEIELAEIADAFIFPTTIMDQQINTKGKPSVIMHGNYQVEPDRGVRLFDDGKIHVLYAGTLDPRKGGAAAAAAAAYLPSDYHIHILGSGGEKERELLLDTIEKSRKEGHADVTYDGLLMGEKFVQFVQSCDIGLSTQNPDAEFNSTSFPSKILTYMANGLQVVSVRIPAVETSAVGQYIHYYDVQSPEEIAKAIMGVNVQESFDSRHKIVVLNRELIKQLSKAVKEDR